jgi:hypothetical protein
MRSRRNHLHRERAAYQISAGQPIMISPCSLHTEIASLFLRSETDARGDRGISGGLSACTFLRLLFRGGACLSNNSPASG